MMSSKDEAENDNGQRFFVVHKPRFRTARYEKLLRIVDSAYTKSCSKRSKDQMIERKLGEPSNRTPPTDLKYGQEIFIQDPLVQDT